MSTFDSNMPNSDMSLSAAGATAVIAGSILVTFILICCLYQLCGTGSKSQDSDDVNVYEFVSRPKDRSPKLDHYGPRPRKDMGEKDPKMTKESSSAVKFVEDRSTKTKTGSMSLDGIPSLPRDTHSPRLSDEPGQSSPQSTATRREYAKSLTRKSPSSQRNDALRISVSETKSPKSSGSPKKSQKLRQKVTQDKKPENEEPKPKPSEETQTR